MHFPGAGRDDIHGEVAATAQDRHHAVMPKRAELLGHDDNGGHDDTSGHLSVSVDWTAVLDCDPHSLLLEEVADVLAALGSEKKRMALSFSPEVSENPEKFTIDLFTGKTQAEVEKEAEAGGEEEAT
jgi:hypothetical protein